MDARPLNEKSTIVTLSSIHEKLKIFKNCHKLRSHSEKISIVENMTKNEREQRKKLLPILHSEKQKGNRAVLRGADLFINGEKFIYANHSVITETSASYFDTQEKIQNEKIPIGKNPTETIPTVDQPRPNSPTDWLKENANLLRNIPKPKPTPEEEIIECQEGLQLQQMINLCQKLPKTHPDRPMAERSVMATRKRILEIQKMINKNKIMSDYLAKHNTNPC